MVDDIVDVVITDGCYDDQELTWKERTSDGLVRFIRANFACLAKDGNVEKEEDVFALVNVKKLVFEAIAE